MIKVRKSEERGHANHGWLDSYHTFSFANYYDPQNMGFRDLRVINQDKVDAGMGFGAHPHNNMEIISYVLEGKLAHKDSMGTSSVIVPGDVQRMSAGTGVVHSEFNNSENDDVRFLQIWILPEEKNIKPSYAQKNFDRNTKLNNLKLIVSKNGDEESITINQDMNLYSSILETNKELNYEVPDNRYVWLHVTSGKVRVNNEFELGLGDAISVSNEKSLNIVAIDESEFLLFDLK